MKKTVIAIIMIVIVLGIVMFTGVNLNKEEASSTSANEMTNEELMALHDAGVHTYCVDLGTRVIEHLSDEDTICYGIDHIVGTVHTTHYVYVER